MSLPHASLEVGHCEVKYASLCMSAGDKEVLRCLPAGNKEVKWAGICMPAGDKEAGNKEVLCASLLQNIRRCSVPASCNQAGNEIRLEDTVGTCFIYCLAEGSCNCLACAPGCKVENIRKNYVC
eukprot:1158532-Pelagomonas_calceolata.AAC.17